MKWEKPFDCNMQVKKRLMALVMVLFFSTLSLAVNLKNGMALVYSFDTAKYVGEAKYRKQFDNLRDILENNFMAVDCLDSNSVGNGALDYYKLAILVGNSCISDTELAYYQQHVNNGGYLIATYDASLRDQNGVLRDNFGLKDLLGISCSSFLPDKALISEFLAGKILPEPILVLTPNFLLVRPDGGGVSKGAFYQSGEVIKNITPLIATEKTLYLAEDIFQEELPKGLVDVLIYGIEHFLKDEAFRGQFSIEVEDIKPTIDEAISSYLTVEREFKNVERSCEEISFEQSQAYLEARQVYQALNFAIDKKLGLKAANYLVRLKELTEAMLPAILPVRFAEARGVWVDSQSLEALKTETDFRNIVRRLHQANINMIFPETIYKGATLYPSKIATQHTAYRELGFDPLTVIIDEAHKLNIEVHPWVWVFCAGYSHQFGPLLIEHPEWIELDQEGRAFSNWEYGTAWINSSHLEARKYLLNLFYELITEYDLDGLNVDYLRYNEDSIGHFGFSNYSKTAFKRAANLDLDSIIIGSSDWIKFNQWREENITSFLREINLMLKSTKPELLISTSVSSDLDYARAEVMQNWQHWADNGYIDFIKAMDYRKEVSTFRSNAKRGIEWAADKIWVFPGIGMYANDRFGNIGQIKATRTIGATGVALFSNLSFQAEKYTDAKEGLFREQALIPMREPLEAIKVLLEEAAEKLERASSLKSPNNNTKEPSLMTQAVLIKETLENLHGCELNLDLTKQLETEFDVNIAKLTKLRKESIIRGNEQEALSSPLFTAKRILSIYLFQQAAKEYQPPTPRTN